jgi:Mn-dependent DtxR family transcriptional regulator
MLRSALGLKTRRNITGKMLSVLIFGVKHGIITEIPERKEAFAMQLLESGEMYLETILILSQQKGTVRSIDVCDHMGYSKPSVSRAVGILRRGGYLNMDPQGALTLTESGYQIATKILERHRILTKALILLGVSEEIATEDACRIEHHISDETIAMIQKHLTDYGN